MGKLTDQYERQAYDWVLPDIQEYFSVENISDVTKETCKRLKDF